jgi:hypothetical protein
LCADFTPVQDVKKPFLANVSNAGLKQEIKQLLRALLRDWFSILG